MDWLTIPAAVLVYLCLKTILNHLEHGFKGWHYDNSRRDVDI